MPQFGAVTIDGQQYVERVQIFPQDVNITFQGQIARQRITLPGVAQFLLKELTREVVLQGLSRNIPFKFRLGNSDGSSWYIGGGIDSTTDRIIDNLCFGTAQFPYAILPPILFSAGANILYEIQDITPPITVGPFFQGPYTINLAFHGSYLIPVIPAPVPMSFPTGSQTFPNPQMVLAGG